MLRRYARLIRILCQGGVCTHHSLEDHALNSWSRDRQLYLSTEIIKLIIAQSRGKSVTFYTPHTPSSCSGKTITAWSRVKTLHLERGGNLACGVTGDVIKLSLITHHWATEQCVCVWEYQYMNVIYLHIWDLGFVGANNWMQLVYLKYKVLIECTCVSERVIVAIVVM